MYTNAQYVNNPFNGNPDGIRVDINGVTSFVPLDPANTDYQRIIELADSGQLVVDPAE